MKKYLLLFSLSFVLFSACQKIELLESETNSFADIVETNRVGISEDISSMMRHFPSESTAKTVYGPTVDVGNGTVRSFILADMAN